MGIASPGTSLPVGDGRQKVGDPKPLRQLAQGKVVRHNGFGQGDAGQVGAPVVEAEARAAVGVFMPMLPETAVATLAVSKIGAIYIPIFSGYGAEAVATPEAMHQRDNGGLAQRLERRPLRDGPRLPSA